MSELDEVTLKVRREQAQELKAARAGVDDCVMEIEDVLHEEFGRIAMQDFATDKIESIIRRHLETAAARALSVQGQFRLEDGRKQMGQILKACISQVGKEEAS